MKDTEAGGRQPVNATNHEKDLYQWQWHSRLAETQKQSSLR